MKRIYIFLFTLLFPCLLFAQQERNKTLATSEKNGWTYNIRAGVNIGGAAPLSMPREIRSIDSYSPRFNTSLEGTVTKWLGQKRRWGVSTGLRLETKSMSTGATVKNYSTEIIDGGSHVAGYWTGYVKTKYSASLLTVPVLADYQLNKRWMLRGGIYLSYRFDGDFSGHVADGYLRQGTPIGEKLEFKDGKTATYDFGSDLRKFQWGLQAGASWKAFRHFDINADLTCGLNDIFNSDFKTVTFNMYPIYLNIGFGYQF